MPKLINIIGNKYGALTVINKVSPNPSAGKVSWTCLCACGGTKVVMGTHLKSGAIASCGCARKTYKHNSKEYGRLYRQWSDMFKRCYSDTDDDINYKLNNIQVCAEWHDFDTYADWALSNGYSDELTIDRIDNLGNYEPGNIRYITSRENTLAMLDFHKSRGTGVYSGSSTHTSH